MKIYIQCLQWSTNTSVQNVQKFIDKIHCCFFFQPSQKKFVAMMACLEKRPTTSDISGVKYKFISRNGVQVLTISPNQTLEFFVLPITYYSDTASLLSALATYKCSKKNRNENQARLQRIIRWNQPHPYHFAWIHPCSFFIVLAIIPTLTPPFWQFHFFFIIPLSFPWGFALDPLGFEFWLHPVACFR